MEDKQSKNRYLLILVSIITVGLLLILGAIIWQAQERGKTFIEVLKLFTSWPFIVAVIAFAAGISFHDEISKYLKFLSIRFPGGTTVSSPTQEPTETKIQEENREGTITLTAGQTEEIRSVFDKIVTDSTREKEELQRLVLEKQRESFYWWFEYLSLFLVPKTKLVLQWFSQQALPVTKEFYNNFWRPIELDEQQREIIFMVLLHHNLIEQNGMTVNITDGGKQFLSFIHERE